MAFAQRGTGGEASFGGQLVPVTGVTGCTFTPVDLTNGRYLTTNVGKGGLSSTFTVSALVTGVKASTGIISIPTISGSISVILDASSKPQAKWVDSIAGTIWTITAAGAMTAGPHHVLLTVSATAASLYVDAVLVASTTGTMPFRPKGGTINVGGSPDMQLWEGIIGQVALWDRVLDYTEILRLSGIVDGHHGDTTGERINRLADYAGIAAGLRNIDPGVGYVIREADGGPASYKIANVTKTPSFNLAAACAASLRAPERMLLKCTSA